MKDPRREVMLKLLASPTESLASVARLFGVSPQRVHQICRADMDAYNSVRRKRRNNGKYTCRRCGKLGHTARSADCPKRQSTD